jgi:hypothetical protein
MDCRRDGLLDSYSDPIQKPGVFERCSQLVLGERGILNSSATCYMPIAL